MLARWWYSRGMLSGLIFGISLLWGSVVQAKTVTVVAAQWPPLTQVDGSGLYFDVLREALDGQDIRFNIRVVNWKRAKQMFYAKRADILLADYHMTGLRQHFPFWHLDMDRPVILFSPQPVQALTQLQGKAVGWLLGYDFDQLLPVRVDGIEVQTEIQGFELLEHQRLDAYISYDEQVPPRLQGKLQRIVLMGAQPLYPVFQNDFAGRKLAEQFDQGMQRLYQSGRLQQLYQQYYQRAAFPPQR